MRMILIVLAALFIGQQYSYATPSTNPASNPTAEDAGAQAALDARNAFISALKTKDFTGITRDAMDGAIRALANLIITNKQDNALAQDLINEWDQSSANFAASILERVTAHDLGDHPPLFPWLETFMQNLTDKYPEFSAIQLFKDIWTLNYAIPVVFTPHGSWEAPDVDNRIEYRLHFIPFADIVTYYTSLFGCDLALKHYGLTDLKKLCPKAATKLDWVMGRYIAPVVSDWIFKAANGSASSELVITDGQLYYQTASQLEAAIQ